MLLATKTAVVYGGGGSVGGAVARAFAGEGARVFLAGRTASTLDTVAADISAAGGEVETAQVNTLDERSVQQHTDAVVKKTGRIDISFNAIGHGDVHGERLIDMTFDDFARPIFNAMRSQFLTAKSSAKHMSGQGSGVIMAITATTARMSVPEIGGTGVAFDSIESLCRQLATELAPRGVRVVWLLTTGLPETLTDSLFPEYGTGSGAMTRDQLIDWNAERTMLKRLTTLTELGDAAVFLASDRASGMTATAMNISCGFVPTR